MKENWLSRVAEGARGVGDANLTEYVGIGEGARPASEICFVLDSNV